MKTKPALPAKQNLHTHITELDLEVYELFSFASHEQLKEGLWNWLRATVCGNYNSDLDESERVFILALYEKFEQLLDTAYQSNQKKKKTIYEHH